MLRGGNQEDKVWAFRSGTSSVRVVRDRRCIDHWLIPRVVEGPLNKPRRTLSTAITFNGDSSLVITSLGPGF